MISTDSRIAVPAVITSSTISTRPASGAPTIVPPSPWSFASLRLNAKGRFMCSCSASAAAVVVTSGMPL